MIIWLGHMSTLYEVICVVGSGKIQFFLESPPSFSHPWASNSQIVLRSSIGRLCSSPPSSFSFSPISLYTCNLWKAKTSQRGWHQARVTCSSKDGCRQWWPFSENNIQDMSIQDFLVMESGNNIVSPTEDFSRHTHEPYAKLCPESLHIPYEFRCPISLVIMKDPVIICTGQVCT